MKKLILISILIVSLMLLTTGCLSGSNQIYQESVEKTANIEKGKSKLILDMNLELDENFIAEVKPIKIEKFEIENKFDKARSLSQSTLFAKINDLGIDAKLYQNGEMYYLTSPLLEKIVTVNLNDFISVADTNQFEKIILDETEEKLEKIWKKLLTDKDVTKLNNIILSTPDGAVKAKEYQLNLTDEDLRSAMLESIDILSEDQLFNKKMDGILKNSSYSTEKLTSVKEMWSENRNFIQNSKIGPLSYLAYIDRDGYIVEEKLTVGIKGGDGSKNTGIKSFSFSYHLQRWDIERDVEINLPNVTVDNSIPLEQFLKQNENFHQWEGKW